jgi:tetratricopeptide (TPR) repeat protein
MNQILGGRYQFIRVLKSSAIGQTYLAEDVQGEPPSPCIVKRLQLVSRNPRTQRFVSILLRKKAEALKSLDCSQVPRILDFFEEGPGFYIVEEYIEGRSLTDRLVPGQPWAEAAILQLLQEVLAIVAVIHRWGVIHRAIEPDHLIQRSTDQRWVLIGFGIFHEISAQVTRSQTPSVEMPVLPPSLYCPPEQLQGQLQFNSDIYAVGMIGIQAATGLSRGDLQALQTQTQNGSSSPRLKWRDHATLSPALADLLDQMVHPVAHQRYQLVADVLADLQQVRHGDPAGSMAGTPERGERSRPSSRRWWRPLGVVAVAAVAAAALMYSQLPQQWLAQRSLRRAEAYRQAGNSEQALVQYGQAIALQPSSRAFYQRAMVQEQLGNRQQALADLAQAIQRDPNNGDLFYQRGNIRFRLGDGEGAIADYTQAIQLDPTNARAWVNRGSVRAELDDDMGAIADYTEAIQINPNLAAAYLNRCLSRSNIGEHQAAIADCTQAIRLQPDSVLAYQNRGLVRRRIGDTRGALEDFNIAIRLDPTDPDPYYNRGLARYELGDRQGAIADYTEAIQRNPGHVFAYYDRAALFAADGDIAAAIADFQQAATLCLDAGRTQCYEDAQFQIRQLQAQDGGSRQDE